MAYDKHFPLANNNERRRTMQYLLCENKRDEVTQMHGFGRGAPARVQVEWLLVFIGIENLIHVSKKEKRKWCDLLREEPRH